MFHPQQAGPNADEQSPSRSISVRIANATSRLILMAVVVGGLVTVVLNISRLQWLADSNDPFIEPDEVATRELLAAGIPVVRTVVRGNEAAARESIVRAGRERLSSEAERVAEMPSAGSSGADHGESLDGTVELAGDVHGKWKILETQELKGVIFGVLPSGRDPAIIFWGGYDETGPGEWSTWTMQLPLLEK